MNQFNQNKNSVVESSYTSTIQTDQRANAPASSPPPYLKLIADCWEYIFDHLSLKDILQMGETCKRMHQMAGYYLREYFPELRFNLIGKDVQVAYPHNFLLRTDFFPYIRKLCILRRGSESMSKLDVETFSSMKTLIYMSVELNRTQFAYARDILDYVENIQIEHCNIYMEIFERFEFYCPKLKSLRVEYGNTDNVLVTKSLFSQYYPQLEDLRYKPNSCHTKIGELKTFFEKHTKLKQFECNMPFLWANRDVLLETNVQLDLFIVDFTRNHHIPSDEFVDFLKSLYKRGFYKALQLSIDRIPNYIFESSNNGICTLPAFEILDINTDSNIDLSRLINLKELHIFNLDYTNVENLARNLAKLEKLSFGNGSIDTILPFICHSKRLKTIYIDRLDLNDFDLFVLNEKRKMLQNARQVTICLKENFYLMIKWKSKHFNLSHVKISRAASEYF